MKKFVMSILLFLIIIFSLLAINNIVFADTLNGWQRQNGKWYYYNNGLMYKNDKFKINNKYYVFDADGVMQENGWYQKKLSDDYSDWYFLNSDGSAVIGWKKLGNTWYYFDETADMIQNWGMKINGKVYCFDKNGAMINKSGWNKLDFEGDTLWYYLNSDGTAVTGWKMIGNTWYYFNLENGIMYNSGARIINNKVYMFNSLGAWIEPKGWYKVNSSNYDKKSNIDWYYFEKSDGTATTGWKEIGNIWYYFFDDGVMADDISLIKGKIYFFNNSGKWFAPQPGWYKVENEGIYWYYIENDGTGVIGWKKIGNIWYYFNENNGIMAFDGIYYINKKQYCFAKSGAMLSDKWYRQENGLSWYYFGSDGNRIFKSGWQYIEGNWYYLMQYGTPFCDGIKYINGSYWRFDEKGVLIEEV